MSLLAPADVRAVLSGCRRYRYQLFRRFGPSPRGVLYIMLNPSTADEIEDDPTIRKCIGFARKWGCGHLTVVNLFAWRATSPADMKRAADPVGPENRHYVQNALARTKQKGWPDDLVICAWGRHGAHRNQDRVMRDWLRAEPTVEPLQLGPGPFPRHPLMLAYSTEPEPLAGYDIGDRS